MRPFAVGGRLSAGVSRQIRRIGGRTGNTYRYASVYFVPLGFAKGWLKGSGGRPAARLFSFGNYPRAGMFRAVLPLRERAISEISTPVARGCQPRRCEPAWLAPSRGGRSARHVSSQGNPLRRAGWLRGGFGTGQACPIRPWYRDRVAAAYEKEPGW